MRRPLLLLAVLCLSGCDELLRQRILDARLRVPHAPSPILPMDSAQRISLDAGFGSSVASLPPGKILDDSSGGRVRITSSSADGSLRFCFHYKALLIGQEIGNGRTTIFGGANLQFGAFQWLGWCGGSLISWHEDILYKQGWGSVENGPVSYWNTFRDTVDQVSLALSTGMAIQQGSGVVRPFAAARLDLGPEANGAPWLSGDPKADNPISLSQLQLDAGLRMDCVPRIHAYAGTGTRIFLSSDIPGNDWRVFGGISIDLWRSMPH